MKSNDADVDHDRRAVLRVGLSALGGLAICMPLEAAAPPSGRKRASLAGGDETRNELSAWLVIDPDGSVTVRVPHQEMGQGTATGLAMLVAEELECDWKTVRVEHASANRNRRAAGKLYGGMTTNRSSGVRSSVDMMQQAGASARERLRLAAAQRWNIDVADCEVESGRCRNRRTRQSLGFGQLAATAAALQLPVEPKPRTPDQFHLVGHWTARLDTPPKVDGSAQFGIDVQVPGMVYAAVQSCPEFGGTLRSVDEAAVSGRRGVIAVVKMKDAVAVVADRYWRAKQALDLLAPTWNDGGNAAVDSAQLDQGYVDALAGPLVTVRSDGNATAAMASPGSQVVEALYEVPYLAHAPMEPLNCTVHLQPDRVDVWIGSQTPMAALQLAATLSGVAPENVHIHNQFLGGGFGRRSQHDELVHAIACARQVGRPVKLIWSREQDMRRDRYRPQAACRMKAVLAAPGQTPTTLHTAVAVGSIWRSLGLPQMVEHDIELMAIDVLANHGYRFPDRYLGLVLRNTHVPVMFWRSVGASQNAFFLESFIDEVAHAAGQDPYRFRRSLLERKDYLGVLDMLAQRSGWGEPMAPGRGRGIAIVESCDSIAGQVTEVTVSPDGEVRIDRVVAVLDCHYAANTNTIAQQIEGSVVWGLSAALYGEVTIRDGAPVQGNFDSAPILRMQETPRIETHLSLSGGPRWGGVGEPSVAVVAPSLCNAIFAATGKRVRKLPIRNADLRSA